jgi:diphthamide biosynthesis enzyme Dph1/Dph2-like protein
MEACMIANPTLKFYQYNPYTKVFLCYQHNIKSFTIEEYAHQEMLTTRKSQIEKFNGVKRVGIIFGILGRQGSLHILQVNKPYS